MSEGPLQEFIDGFIEKKIRKELAYELIFGDLGTDVEAERMMTLGRVGAMPNVAMVVQADSDLGCCFQRDVLLARRNAVFDRLSALSGSRSVPLGEKGFHSMLATIVGERDAAVLLPLENAGFDGDGARLSKEYAGHIKAHVEKGLDFTVTIAIGRYYPMFRNVKNSYEEACRALVSKFYKGNGSVIHIEDLEICNQDRQQFFIECEALIQDSMRKGDWARVTGLTGFLADTIEKSGSVYPDTIKVRMLEMLTVLSRAAIDLGGDPGGLLDLKVRAGVEIGMITTLMELRAWIAGITGEICRFVMERQAGTAARAVARIKQYINENYARDISLDELARHVFLSPFYLSRIFSEEAETSITGYVKKVRIGKAQSLLMNSDKSITEVAYSVGYKDPNYFSRVFKDLTGKAPHQYRKGCR